MVVTVQSSDSSVGKRIGQLRVVFKIPDEYLSVFGSGPRPGHLVYIQWFTRLTRKGKDHALYPVSRSFTTRGDRSAAVIELDTVIRPCPLFPRFDEPVNRAWTSANVLERCDRFFVNPFGDHHMYQAMF